MTSTTGKARQTVAALRRSGAIAALPCEVCGSTDRVEAHHPFGYEGPNALAVWWLCPTDHARMHRQAEAEAKRPDGAQTLKEAAISLGVTPDNLRQAIARQALVAEKRGRDWFVTSREVERYRTEHRRSVSRVNRAG